jgi:hypothetical protein
VPSVRASDNDREQVSDQLRHATAEGRLTAAELEERLGTLYAARTYGEIDALVADLPAAGTPGERPAGIPRWAGAAAAAALLVAVLGMLDRIGHSAAAAGGPGRLRPSRFPPGFGDPHHGLMLAASTAGVCALLGLGMVLVWMLLESARAPDG